MNDEITVFLRNGISSYDDEILDEYHKITGNEYNGSCYDPIMLKLLIVNNYIGSVYYIVKVIKKFLPYCVINSTLVFETIHFDINKYKVDMIKRMLSSEHEDKVTEIETIVFSDINVDSIIIR